MAATTTETTTGSALVVSVRGRFLEVRDPADVPRLAPRASSEPPPVVRGSANAISFEQQLYVNTLWDRSENLVRNELEREFESDKSSFGKSSTPSPLSSPDLRCRHMSRCETDASMNLAGMIEEDSDLVKQDSLCKHASSKSAKTVCPDDDACALYDEDKSDGESTFGEDDMDDHMSGVTKYKSDNVVHPPCGSNGRTLMLRNIPCRVNQEELVRIVEEMGLGGRYDYLYVPLSHRPRANIGYAFVNLISEADEIAFKRAFDGFRFPGTLSQKVCAVQPARLQGSLAQFTQRRKVRARLPAASAYPCERRMAIDGNCQ